MEYVLRPLNITRQVTILATGAGVLAGVCGLIADRVIGGNGGSPIWAVVVIAGVAALCALGVGFFFRQRLADLWQLVIAARRMGQGDLTTPITTRGTLSEVYSLAVVLEQNRQRISTMLGELEAAKEWSDSQRSVQAYFLANISHEFRTPLAGMQVTVELLRENAHRLPPEELDELLGALHLSIASMGQLIDNLLESSKIEADQLVLRRQSIEAEQLISEAARLVLPFLSRRRQQLTLDMPLEAPVVSADRGRLVQVLVNLIANASKYSPPGSTIDIGLARSGDTVRLSVSDRGPGIPEDKRDGVFKRFVRLGATASEDYGAGLGLSVVKAIVAAHGGVVGVDARPGGGSQFWVELCTQA
ncbi:MAG: sensor histidine kinase [Chloroflexi bacterium]|jgi:signal transduction histidine kinase|nr:MAG: putative two-component histidine kinase [Chloroflexi bacterium OLB13]MBC6955637.1 sensor histidine kinase [Chloroflexota bacterium]MBV6435193.1 Adaptive-response sensory-kinase SasA [Anaerolineae bacterium]MDL1915099.1 HAMP domain-containing histidine kinase [Anaerolineae bacterium CFX4]OQY82521.1 MAG: hypothetical protein B6D42_09305 [Anaerolineae bacterium UTCFX5]